MRPAVLALAVAAFMIGSPSAFGQLHGVRIGKSCVSPKCVGDTLNCTIEVGHDDDFGDTLELLEAFDTIDPEGHNTRVPAAGNLTIINVAGNTNCTVGGALPCRLCPAGSSACGPGVPNQGLAGVVAFEEKSYFIQPGDPNPLPDRANIRISDLCDAPGTTGCSSVPNTIQFTASTTILNCDDFNNCTIDTCVGGECFHDPECELDSECDTGDACLTEFCDPNGCCDSDPLCPGRICCANGEPCNDGNLCTDDVCDGDGCCRFEPRCPPQPCFFVTCNPATGDCESTPVVCQNPDCEECNPNLGRCVPIVPLPEGCLVCEADCPPVVKAKMDIWNQNEHGFSGTERCISSWDQTLLSRYTDGRPGNNFMRNVLQTDKGKARIDGMASTVCDHPQLGPLSVNAPLLGLAIREIMFTNGREFTASELTGQGFEVGAIAYDLFGGPPPGEATGESSGRLDLIESARSKSAKPAPTGRGGAVEPIGTQGISPIAGGKPAIPLNPSRASTSQKGSLLVFPKWEIKWDAAGNLIQDTIIELTNDASSDVSVQMYLVHGDLCIWVDNNFVLTDNHPVYWSVLTGLPGLGNLGGAMSPATVLGDGCPDEDDVTNPGGRVLRGYLVLWAVDTETNAEIRWNHLSGSAMIIKYRDTSAWEYNPWAFQAVLDVEDGETLLEPFGFLWLDGREYQIAPALLLMDFFASGATLMLEGGPLSFDTDLTLWAALKDLRQDPNLDEILPIDP